MSASTGDRAQAPSAGTQRVIGVVAWLWVGLPFLYGLVQLVAKIPALFAG